MANPEKKPRFVAAVKLRQEFKDKLTEVADGTRPRHPDELFGR